MIHFRRVGSGWTSPRGANRRRRCHLQEREGPCRKDRAVRPGRAAQRPRRARPRAPPDAGGRSGCAAPPARRATPPGAQARPVPRGTRPRCRPVAACPSAASQRADGSPRAPPAETCSVEIGQGSPSASRKATVVAAERDTDSVGTASSSASDRSTTRTPAADSEPAAAACASAAAVATTASAVRGRAGRCLAKFHLDKAPPPRFGESRSAYLPCAFSSCATDRPDPTAPMPRTIAD